MPKKTEKPTEKKITKDTILTELFNSGQIHRKVSGICFRFHIHKDTQIEEDIVQETFLHLSKKSEEYLMEMYLDNPNRLEALAVTIAIRKGVMADGRANGYPKHSLAQFILYTSNLNQTTSVSPSEYIEDDYEAPNHTTILTADEEEENPEYELWEQIRSHLTTSENEFLNKYLYQKKGRGRYQKEVLNKINQLKERIKQIIIDNNIKTYRIND